MTGLQLAVARCASWGSIPALETGRTPSLLHGRTIKRDTATGRGVQLVALLAALAIGVLAGTVGTHTALRGRTPCRASRAPGGELSMPASLPNTRPPVLVRPAALLLGDSLTERAFDEGGWGAALAHHFSRKVDVVNRGFGGYNSRWLLPVMDQVLAQVRASKQEVLFATLWLGANDAALPDRSGAQQAVPLPEYRANLEAMLARLRAAGVRRVLLITPPAVWDEGRVAYLQQRMGTSEPLQADRTNAHAALYAAAASELGGAAGVPVLDLHVLLQRQPGWQRELLLDGLHFTPAGQAFVGRQVIGALADAFPDLSLEALPNHMPWWDKLAGNWPGEWESFSAAAAAAGNSGGSSGGPRGA